MVLVAFAAACGSSGAPQAYDEQESTYEDLSGNEVTAPLTEVNYRRACEETNKEMDASAAISYCRCTYNKWVDNVPYDLFLAFQDRINEKRDSLEGAKFDQLASEYGSVIDEMEEELKAVNAVYEEDLSALIGFPCTEG